MNRIFRDVLPLLYPICHKLEFPQIQLQKKSSIGSNKLYNVCMFWSCYEFSVIYFWCVFIKSF